MLDGPKSANGFRLARNTPHEFAQNPDRFRDAPGAGAPRSGTRPVYRGLVRGFLVLSAIDGTPLAQGDLIQLSSASASTIVGGRLPAYTTSNSILNP